mgnify:FL=1
MREKENINIDVPTSDVEDFLYYVRLLADERNISSRRAFGELVRGVYQQLMEKEYDRQDRKSRQRGRHNC